MFWMGAWLLATALAKSGFIAWIAKLIGTAVAPLIWAGLHPSSLSPSFISILTIASLRLQPVFLRCTQHSWQLPPPAVFRLCWLPSHSAASLTCRFRWLTTVTAAVLFISVPAMFLKVNGGETALSSQRSMWWFGSPSVWPGGSSSAVLIKSKFWVLNAEAD